MTPASPNWTPPVVTCSALTNDGLPELWEQIVAHREKLTATGERAQRRQRQQIGWMWSLIGDRLLDEFRASEGFARRLARRRRRFWLGICRRRLRLTGCWRLSWVVKGTLLGLERRPVRVEVATRLNFPSETVNVARF